ncbi:hypothetical protein [Akkermansia sp.]|uniref:hypothetical protein n=1 Tax=Akkermansia sp. TaxID=1872421 RepID=UPI003A902EDB
MPWSPVSFQYRRMDHAKMPVQPGEVRMNKGALFSLAAGRYFMRYRGRLHEELSCRGGRYSRNGAHLTPQGYEDISPATAEFLSSFLKQRLEKAAPHRPENPVT